MIFKFVLSNIDGKAIITKVSKSKKDQHPIGTEVVEVNRLLTNHFIEQNIKPYISSSTEHILNDQSIEYLLEGYKGSNFDLLLKLPNSNQIALKATLNKSKEQELYPQEKANIFEFWIP